MAIFQDFHDALQNWIQEAIPIVEQDGTHALPTFLTEQWHPSGDGSFNRFPQPRLAWLRSDQTRLQALTSWDAVTQAVNGNEQLSSQFGQLVGGAYGASLLELFGVAVSMIPTPEEVGGDTSALFEQRYGPLDAFLAASELEQIAIYPLSGLVLATDPIRLDNDVSLDRLSDEEIMMALNNGILKTPMAAFPVFNVPQHGVACLRFKMTSPKRVGQEGIGSQIQTLFQKHAKVQKNCVDRLRSALVLLSSSPTACMGMFSFQGYWSQGQSMSFQTWPNERIQTSTLAIDQSLGEEMQTIWSQLKTRRVSRSKTVNLALSRLNAQDQRYDDQDQILDIIIAAEAIYLTDIEGEYRGENRYRLALRAATWADLSDSALSRKGIYKLLTSAYRIRNSIAHGTTPRPEDLTVDGVVLSLQDFIRKVEDIVRLGAKKAVKILSSGESYPPDWELQLLSD